MQGDRSSLSLESLHRFNLGPGEDEKYHEITAVGMKDVTTEFGKYDLEEINQEFLNNASSAEKNYILPKTVGGPKVHLLYGIRKTKIQPVLIKVLPSGVGVYLSPFKDVEGSRIIYAGPRVEPCCVYCILHRYHRRIL